MGNPTGKDEALSKLKNIYVKCTDIHIHPYNANIPSDDPRYLVKIEAHVAHKCHYAKLSISEKSYEEAIDRLHDLVLGYCNLVDGIK